MNKIEAKPIWVSDIKPVYANGHLLLWNVNVRFDGDLASWHNENPLPRNAEDFKRFMHWTDKDIAKMEDDHVLGGHKSIEGMFYEFKQENAFLYKTEIPYILDSGVCIPKYRNVSTVEWDEKSKVDGNKYANTLVGYAFLKGWFGSGLGHAQSFRNKILAQIGAKNR